MTEALTPDTAMVVPDEFKGLLPDGWFVTGYRAEINRGGWGREERILEVQLRYVDRPVEVWMELRAMPDRDWLSQFLQGCQALPKGTRIGAALEERLF